MRDWIAWQWDAPTAAWVAMALWFLAWEGWAVHTGQWPHTLTWHLRPFLLAHPLARCVGIGVWLWLGVHFLFPELERAMTRSGL